jgi:hypothetical protein
MSRFIERDVRRAVNETGKIRARSPREKPGSAGTCAEIAGGERRIHEADIEKAGRKARPLLVSGRSTSGR